MLYKLLTVWQPFNEWSNKGNGGKVGNLETLHDGIHNSFGAGHMAIVDVAAFDPAFLFHHWYVCIPLFPSLSLLHIFSTIYAKAFFLVFCSNVDRIMALFQARYPDNYVEPAPQAASTYAIEKDSIQSSSSPLPPFHMNANGDFWTSATVINTESFGYTYPELMSSPDNDTLTATINKLYRPQTQGLNKNNTITTRDTLHPLHLRNWNSTSLSSNPNNSTTTNSTTPTISPLEPANHTADAIDWIAEVNMPSDILDTYSVRAFLGPFDERDPKNWATDPAYVGQVASLGGMSKMKEEEEEEGKEEGVIVTANIGLTERLAEGFKRGGGGLGSLRRGDVVEYLKGNFHWRVQFAVCGLFFSLL